MKINTIKKATILILFFILSLFHSFGYKKYVKSDFVMNTTLTIILFSNNKETAPKILEHCFVIADKLEKKCSNTIENSIISILNKKQQATITDNFVLNLIKESINYAIISDGAFDPSLYQIIRLWGFEGGKMHIPPQEDINNALTNTGYKYIKINDDNIALNGVQLDLGGIAKGKIIDNIAHYLKQSNINDFIVNGGGDIAVSGKFNNIRAWKIAIANPFNDNDNIGGIQLENHAIVTSGDYERYFIENDKRYHHIINPTTGYPTNNGIHSITVISDSVERADAWATALFVMGVKKGLKLANATNDIEVIFISGNQSNPQIITTSNITKKLNGEYWIFNIGHF